MLLTLCIPRASIYHCRITLYNAVQHCITLYSAVQHCITLYNAVQHCITLYNAVQHCITLYNAVQHCMTLCNLMHFIYFDNIANSLQPAFILSLHRNNIVQRANIVWKYPLPPDPLALEVVGSLPSATSPALTLTWQASSSPTKVHVVWMRCAYTDQVNYYCYLCLYR